MYWLLAQIGGQARLAGEGGGEAGGGALGLAPSFLDPYLHWVVNGIAIIGALIIVWGVVSGFLRLIPVEFAELTGGPKNMERENHIRRRMGFHLLTGLEFLVAADIIATLITPDWQHLATLGVIVVIRIVVGATLHWELSQRDDVREKGKPGKGGKGESGGSGG